MPTIPEILHGLSPAGRERLLGSMPEHQLRAAERSFPEWAHAGQLAPASTPTGDDWRTWVLMAGRGFGKTRAGAEWVLDCVRSPSRSREGLGEGVLSGLAQQALPQPLPPAGGERAALRIALVAATADEARAVMVEGPSGILACAGPNEIADWLPSRGLLKFASGARSEEHTSELQSR